MAEFLAEYFTDILMMNGIICSNKRKFYMYGLELFFIKVSFYVTILVLSLITGTLAISIAYILFFTLLRQYTGGYHNKSFILCFLTSILIYLVMIFIYLIAVKAVAETMVTCAVVSYVLILLSAPMASSNKPFLENEQRKYRIISFLLASIYCLIALITLKMGYYQVSYIFSWSLTVDAVLILLAKIYKRRNA